MFVIFLTIIWMHHQFHDGKKKNDIVYAIIMILFYTKPNVGISRIKVPSSSMKS
jgi:hypothetical protein